jgi:hypothetical protein
MVGFTQHKRGGRKQTYNTLTYIKSTSMDWMMTPWKEGRKERREMIDGRRHTPKDKMARRTHIST